MQIYIGKLKEVSLAATPANVALTTPRVPISSVSFRPCNISGPLHEYHLLTAGGSAVALWKLSKSETYHEAPRQESEYNNESSIQLNSGIESQNVESNCWLHAEKVSTQLVAERLGFFSDHAPEYVTRVQWSPNGDTWASADGKRVLIFVKKMIEDNTVWIRQHCIIEPAVQEIFDFSYIDDSRLIIGGFARAIIKSIPDITPLTSTHAVALDDGEFVKGICTQIQDDQASAIICLATSNKSVRIYSFVFATSHLLLILIDRVLFADGPSDHPGLRYASIDPSGRFVSVAYGARKHDTFGAMYDLKEIVKVNDLRSKLLTIPESQRREKSEHLDLMLAEAKYRVRGHQTRINCVSFGHQIHPFKVRPSEFLADRSGPLSLQMKQFLANRFEEVDRACMHHARWPKYVMYAQTSIEGLLSLWQVFIPSGEEAVSGMCLMATPHMLVDQAGLISAMDWSSDDRIIAIGSDDGKLTCIVLDDEKELNGPRKLVKSSRTACQSSTSMETPLFLVTPLATEIPSTDAFCIQ